MKVVIGNQPTAYPGPEEHHNSSRHDCGKSLKAKSNENVVKASPIIWIEKAGTLPHPFLDQHLVIIALDDLGQHKALPMVGGGGTFACGRDILLSGDKDMRCNARGGGLAFFIMLKILLPHSLYLRYVDNSPTTISRASMFPQSQCLIVAVPPTRPTQKRRLDF